MVAQKPDKLVSRPVSSRCVSCCSRGQWCEYRGQTGKFQLWVSANETNVGGIFFRACLQLFASLDASGNTHLVAEKEEKRYDRENLEGRRSDG